MEMSIEEVTAILKEHQKTLNVDKGIEFCQEVEALSIAIDTMRKYQRIEQILNTNVVYRDSDFMMLSAIKRVIDGNKQEDLFWKFIDEV